MTLKETVGLTPGLHTVGPWKMLSEASAQPWRAPASHPSPAFSFRASRNSSCSSDGPVLGARRGLHAGSQPWGLPGFLPCTRRGPSLVCQPSEALVAPAPLDAGPHLGHALLGHGVGGLWRWPQSCACPRAGAGGAGPFSPLQGPRAEAELLLQGFNCPVPPG